MSEPEKDEREAAIQTLEYARGYAQAWREWNACATVPHSFDRNFLERNRVRVGERSSEAVKVLRELQQEIPANAENARLGEAPAICTRCGVDLNSGADCQADICLGSEGEIEWEDNRAMLAAAPGVKS